MRLISFSLNKIQSPSLIIHITGYCTLAGECASAKPDKCPVCLYTMSNLAGQPNSRSFRSVLMPGVQISSGSFFFFLCVVVGILWGRGFLIWEYLGPFFYLQSVQCPVSTSQMSKTISVGRWQAEHMLECVCSSILYYVKRNSVWSLEILKLCITPV